MNNTTTPATATTSSEEIVNMLNSALAAYRAGDVRLAANLAAGAADNICIEAATAQIESALEGTVLRIST
jgi:hypothetical protein